MTLNKNQQYAYETNYNKVLVLAGAGTGKTHTMINRIHRLVDNRGVNPRNILVLTFTNAAAIEMIQRYKKLVGENRHNFPTFKTFHGFCYSLICEDIKIRNLIGYSSIPDVIDEGQLKNIKNDVILELGLKLSLKKLENKKIKLSMVEEQQRKLYVKSLDKKLKSKNVITFDMLINRVCNLFTSDNLATKRYINRYQYIFIDEFQDTDPLQWEFAKCFDKSDLFIIGDAMQSIYGFRGADSSIIRSISKDPDWQVIKLDQNYRSTEQIVEYANNISKIYDTNYSVKLKSSKVGDRVIDLRIHDNKYEMDRVLEFCQESVGTVALLARTNREVSKICKFLKSVEVDFSFNSEYSELKDILKSAVDDEYFKDTLLAKLNAETYFNIIRILRLDDESTSIDRILELIPDSCDGYLFAKRVNDIKCIIDCELNLSSKYYKIVEKLGISNKIRKLPDSTVFESHDDMLADMLNKIDKISGSQIYVGTIHSSKGLEYDNVIVFGVEGKSFKLNNEENRNLYYVAVTRAKSRLMVIHDN